MNEPTTPAAAAPLHAPHHAPETSLPSARLQRLCAEPHDANIMENNLDAIISVNPAGLITDWNPAAEQIFGYTRALVLGRESAGFIAPLAGRDPQHTDLAQTLHSGKGRLIGKRTEMTAQRAHGGEFPIELTITPTMDHGTPLLTLCIRDITERRLAEEIMHKSEERFRMLIEGVDDYAIHLLDTHGRVLTWNAGVERIDGYRARDIIGRRFSRLYTPEDIALGKPEQALIMAGADGHYSQEGWSVRKDGSRFWASIVLTALRYENGVLFGFSRIGCDHTKRKEAEAEAARFTTALESELRERTAELQAARQLLREAKAL